MRGRVQGVGFRPFVHQLATSHGLTGWVRNDEQGVLLEVQGADVQAVPGWLRERAPPLARVDDIECDEVPPLASEPGFVIEASGRGGLATVAIGPDAGLCAACAEEVCTPSARRYRYPFTTCTHCGPRYTITRALPYDRRQTSMARFALCADCAREYADPADRRFHAQPLACPACGPRLSSSLEAIIGTVRAGGIVAVKGLGGYQLVCDAADEAAVARLRGRKQRDGKPFAVMVASLASARRLVTLSEAEAALLTSWQRPVVLARRLGSTGVAPSVAPGLAWLGVMLPTSPLHLLLFHEARGRPDGLVWLEAPDDVVLVVTSANPGGAPLVRSDDEARATLGGLADLLVTHDRDVVVRADDSVTRVVAGAPVLLRRARGYVPGAVKLPRPGPPVLALGGHLKVTVCLTRGDEAFGSQHVGDLDDAATFAFLRETIAHLERTLEVTPALVAHDLHPDFLSTRLAQSLGLPAIPVQHHHAHLAGVLCEAGRQGPTVGLALDGFGLGTDGGAWGGELLRLEGAGFTRLGHLAPLRLPGGDRAAREPWRMALAALHRLGETTTPSGAPPEQVEAVRGLLARGVNSPWTTSCGRLFDAACGLLGVMPVATFEGEAPMRLESLVTQPVVLDGGWRVADGVLVLDGLLAALPGRAPADGADLFHGTLAAALVDFAVPHVVDGVIALSGGCLMNAVLAELLVRGFAAQGVRALLNRAVPPNDGGLSLGQAFVAAALA
ncbi:MAG: carbamoyltransferase HypF [Myxococcaceae bacterium]|nr:carbamoyltransferase HypF [Myxococcaceae bacterium]MCA3014000.1 carbamoyltransferase HypF [Myxococcaceae bacterium]